MLMVLVDVYVKPECVEEFKTATEENAKNSLKEPGIARFDVLQDKGNPNRFILNEVYKNEDAPAKHKETEHYKIWREAVEPMMSLPRSSTKFETIFPMDSGWSSGYDF